MLNLAFAALSVPAPCSLSATLTTTAAPSGGIITSAAATVTVPAGNSGGIYFRSFSFSGVVSTLYIKNGGAPVVVAQDDFVSFANGDTLAVRGTSMVAGESWTFTLQDASRSVNIGTYTITAS